MGRKPNSRYLAKRISSFRQEIKQLELENDRLKNIIVDQAEKQL